jgi:aminocarboxymuconate-semialdehyde decarboxylase
LRIVDAHAHILSPAMLEEWSQVGSRFANVSMESSARGVAFLFPDAPPSSSAPPELSDIDGLIARLDREGIDAAVVSPWTDLLGYGLPAEEGAAWCRWQNEHLMDLVRKHSRLVPTAAVPLQDGLLAAKELRVAADMGFAGVEIGTSVGDVDLDDPLLEPFWDAAADHELPIFIHPTIPGIDDGMRDRRGFGLGNSVGRIVYTTVAVTKLMFAGTLAQRRGLKVLVAHGGAAIPYVLGRLRRAHEIAPSKSADPMEGFDRLYFDSVQFDGAALRYLIEVAGSDRVLLGSDYPFPNREADARSFVEGAVGEAEVRQAVLGGNAETLFNM